MNYIIPNIQYTQPNTCQSLFNSKKMQLGQLIEELQKQVQERKEIKINNIYRIEKDSCDITTQMMQTEQFSYIDNYQIPQLKNKINDLNKEKRQELTQFWKDTINLKKSIAYTIIEYERLKQKEQLL